MSTVLQDVRYAMRMFLKSPGFALVALVALALGIGANTAIFSVVNAVMLRALPYSDADRLVVLWEHNRQGNNPHNVLAPANFMQWRDEAKSFTEMAAFYDARLNLTGEGEPEEIPTQVTTANLFRLLGREAAMGRTFMDEDAEAGKNNVVIISHGLWQRRFGGTSDVVGKKLSLNGQVVTVLGVMPEDFRWFIKENSLVGKPAELWLPTKFDESYRNARGRFISAAARLRDGVSVEQAQAEMSGIAARLEREQPQSNTGWGATVVPVREQFAGEIKTALLVLLGAVAFVLLIACANVANLMLARATARQKEIAIRAAMGAGRLRVARQLLTESVLLSLAGGALGLLLALWGVDALVALSPPNLIGNEGVGISLPVLGFTFAVSLLTGVVFGLAPALEASRFNLNDSLKESGKSNAGSSRGRRVRNVFVVAQVALALVLLVGAGLMIRSFSRLQSVDPGFDPQGLLTMRVQLPGAKYKETAQRIAFYREAVERMRALPGVRSAGVVSYLPFASLGARTDFAVEGRPAALPGQEPGTDVRVTDENYFAAMNIPVLRGRGFTTQEATEDRKVVIINEALARKYFPNEDPLGKRLIIQMKKDPEPTEIIGIVRDAKYDKLEGETYPMVYWTYPHLPYTTMTLVMRTNGDPTALAAAAQREIQAIDKDQPVADVRTMESWVGESISRARFGTMLLTVFAGVALVLAAVGIYGVMSYSVTQRTHEIGIRIALGAQTRDVLRLVVGQGMLLIIIGLVLGLVAAYALTRVMTSMLYGVSATDPLTFASISVLLASIALLACYIPARRATRVDPMIALRYE
ncbi:MAG TPA: ABC transporter permease [Pyrinomonadaceae bacterium]|nr:ABC transporter permease [Pyrinomonadaceae bacterium]